MISLIRGLVSLVIASAAILFAIGNMETVSLALIPFYEPFSVPLFLVGLGGALLGFVAGAFIMWLRSLNGRFSARRQRKRLEALEKDLLKTDDQAVSVMQNAPEKKRAIL